MNPRLVRMAKRLNFLWHLLPKRGAPASTSAGPIKSILVIDLHLIGDVVMLLPLLESLKVKFPDARLCLLAGPWSQFALIGRELVDELIPFSAGWVKSQDRAATLLGFLQAARRLRIQNWDLGIDVRGDVRQILLLYLAGCRRRIGFDFTGGRRLLTNVVPDDGRLRHILDHHERLAQSLGAWNGNPFVPALSLSGDEERKASGITRFTGFHFGASLALRRLPPEEASKLVCAFAMSDEPLVLFTSSEMEEYTNDVMSRLPTELRTRVEVWRGDLRAFVVKASRASRLFTMDSGPAHIAAALGRETIVFFGPNLPQYTAPRGRRVVIVEDKTVTCRPCDQHHCTNHTHQACMRGLANRWIANSTQRDTSNSTRDQFSE